MTTAEIVRVRLELNRSMRAREDAVALRLLDRIDAENRQKHRERFARGLAQSEFFDARRRRA